MAEYFYSKEDAVDAIKRWHKEYTSTPLFFGRINLYGREQWIVDYKRTDYTTAAFTVLENLTAELEGILHTPATGETEGAGVDPSHWREIFKAEMIRFLTSPHQGSRTANR
jgi:hypothetical protein